MKNNLERLIKQKIPFSSPQQKAGVGFLYLSYRIENEQKKFFQPYGITLQQYNILRILRGQLPNVANINLLKERMLDNMCDASRLVDRLVTLGFATKKPNATDKRHADVMITEKALTLLKEIDVKMKTFDTIFEKLPLNEIEKLNKLIDKLLEYV